MWYLLQTQVLFGGGEMVQNLAVSCPTHYSHVQTIIFCDMEALLLYVGAMIPKVNFYFSNYIYYLIKVIPIRIPRRSMSCSSLNLN